MVSIWRCNYGSTHKLSPCAGGSVGQHPPPDIRVMSAEARKAERLREQEQHCGSTDSATGADQRLDLDLDRHIVSHSGPRGVETKPTHPSPFCCGDWPGRAGSQCLPSPGQRLQDSGTPGATHVRSGPASLLPRMGCRQPPHPAPGRGYRTDCRCHRPPKATWYGKSASLEPSRLGTRRRSGWEQPPPQPP